jgi:ferredoxin
MIEIDHARCDSCGACISVCASLALMLAERLECSADKCTRCGVCVRVCPFGALKLTRAGAGEEPDVA